MNTSLKPVNAGRHRRHRHRAGGHPIPVAATAVGREAMHTRNHHAMAARRPSWRSAILVAVIVMAAVGGPMSSAAARPARDRIVLPGATSAEGIAIGSGSTFYAGDLFAGDIYRGDLQRGTASLFINAPPGRMAVGMAVDQRHGLLVVAGGFTGQAYLYDIATGATVAVYQLGDPTAGTVINDVTVTRSGAWFTDSTATRLSHVPISPAGVPGPAETLPLSGPAAALTGPFNLNGIAATPNGSTLIVAHTANAALYAVDPTTGASAQITGVSVPNVDGIVLGAGRLWAVQGFNNQISVIDPGPDLTSGVLTKVITSDLFQVPSTAVRHGHRLAVVNAKFDTGIPPTADTYEVVIVDG
jgi:sugar lactone lactonase YvrE